MRRKGNIFVDTDGEVYTYREKNNTLRNAYTKNIIQLEEADKHWIKENLRRE